MTTRRVLALTGLALLCASGSRSAGPFQLYTITPCRLVDTRDATGFTGGPILAANTPRHFPIYGNDARPCGLPNTIGEVKAVTLNLAVIQPTATGNLIVYKFGSTFPATSNLNYSAGELVIANGALVEVASNANQHITVYPSMAAGASVHLVIDITGYHK